MEVELGVGVEVEVGVELEVEVRVEVGGATLSGTSTGGGT